MFTKQGNNVAEEVQKKQPTIISKLLCCVGSSVWCWKTKQGYECALCYIVYNEGLQI